MTCRRSLGFPVCAVVVGSVLACAAPARGGVVINSATRTVTAYAWTSIVKSSTSLGQYDDSVSLHTEVGICGPGQFDEGYAELHSFIGDDGLTMSGTVSRGYRIAKGALSCESAVHRRSRSSFPSRGADTTIPGTQRMYERSSTPWCVGPSAPTTPARSIAKITGTLCSATSCTT